MERRSIVVTWIANALLLLSLFLPAGVTPPSETFYGYHVLMLGILGPIILQFGWIGNIALPLLLSGRFKWLRYLTGVAFVNSIFWTFIVDDTGEKAVTHLAGYYVWMAAMFLGTLPLAWLNRKSATREHSKS